MSEKDKTPRLINLATGEPAKTRLVEVAPGQYAVGEIHPEDVPRFGVVRMMRQGDGSYIPVLKQSGQYVRMARELPDLLGLKGLSSNTLYRLVAAGFVGSSRPAPGVIMVDLLSLCEHIEAAKDTEFWTHERRIRWSNAIAETQGNRFLRGEDSSTQS